MSTPGSIQVIALKGVKHWEMKHWKSKYWEMKHLETKYWEMSDEPEVTKVLAGVWFDAGVLILLGLPLLGAVSAVMGLSQLGGLFEAKPACSFGLSGAWDVFWGKFWEQGALRRLCFAAVTDKAPLYRSARLL